MTIVVISGVLTFVIGPVDPVDLAGEINSMLGTRAR